MAAVQGKDIPQEQEVFNKCWLFLKTYYRMEAPTEWDNVLNDAAELYAHFTGTDVETFAHSLILDVIKRLEQVNNSDK